MRRHFHRGREYFSKDADIGTMPQLGYTVGFSRMEDHKASGNRDKDAWGEEGAMQTIHDPVDALFAGKSGGAVQTDLVRFVDLTRWNTITLTLRKNRRYCCVKELSQGINAG